MVADGTSTETYYNAQGLPQYTTDRHAIGQAANGTESIYDAAGRVIGTDRVSSLVIGITENLGGVSTETLTNPGTVYSTTSQTLNAAGQVLSSTDAAGLVTTYAYDSMGHQTSITSASSVVSYSYDAQNRLSTVVDNNLPAGANTTNYSYDLVGNIASVTDSNGMVTTYTYNALNRLTEETVKDANGNTLASYTYTLDNAGNRTGVTETQLLPNGTTDTRIVAYQYDNLYRLLTETIAGDSQGGNGTVTYAYDLVGNRMSRTSSVAGVSTVTDTYNANDELISEVSGGVTTTYQYDANGNTIETSNGTTITTFMYDSQNRLIKQNAGQTNEVDITYNGQGNKVAETVNGVTTKYLIDCNNPTGYSQVVEEIVNGAVTRRYALGHWIISETQNISGNWTTSYYGYDGHNSVRFLTNTSGAVTDNYTFDAFGIKIAGSGTTPNQILYSGEYLDPGTGNYDLRARVYNENTGTFLTRDTYAGQNGDPITLHQYLYAGADPVMMADPSGRDFSIPSLTVSIGIMSTLSGIIGGVEGGLQHGLLGIEAGFVGSFVGTGFSLALLPWATASFGPIGTAFAFGAGSAIETGLEDLILNGIEGFHNPSEWTGIVTSFFLGAGLGYLSNAGSYYLQQEVESEIDSIPSVWNFLGQVQNKSGVLPMSVAESGLVQDVPTMLAKLGPRFFQLGKEIVFDIASDKGERAILQPTVQLVVDVVEGLYSVLEQP